HRVILAVEGRLDDRAGEPAEGGEGLAGDAHVARVGAEAGGGGADGGDDRAVRGGVAQGDLGGRFAQRRQQRVRDAAAEVDHAGGEDRVEIFLAAVVAAAVDRDVRRFHAEVGAEVARVLGGTGGGGEEGDGLALEMTQQKVVDLARLAEGELAAADEYEKVQLHGEVDDERHRQIVHWRHGCDRDGRVFRTGKGNCRFAHAANAG